MDGEEQASPLVRRSATREQWIISVQAGLALSSLSLLVLRGLGTVAMVGLREL